MPKEKKNGHQQDKRLLESRLDAALDEYSRLLEANVENEKNNEHLRHLTEFSLPGEFFALTDLKEQAITRIWGIEKWLGISPAPTPPLSPSYIANLVHPYIRDWYAALTNAANC